MQRKNRMIHEPARQVPVTAEVDVLVVGAGPAGYGAALAAARNGARTLLLEQSNCVGGMATSGMMSHFSGARTSPYFLELMAVMRANPAGRYVEEQNPGHHCIYHETLKSAMLQKLSEAGVHLKLYTFACDSIMDGDRLTGVIYENKSGRGAILANIIIDCSGDGDIAARAGAAFQLGREEDSGCQPVTTMFRIGGVDYSRAIFPGSFESYMDIPQGEVQSLGKSHLPHPAGHVLLYRTWIPGEVCVNMTNVTGINGTNADDLTRAELTCREQMNAIVPFLREFVPGYEHCYLVASAQNVGVRETRHFKGLYQLTAEDIVEARDFPDWIATRNYFNFDIHNLKGHGLDEAGAQKHFQAKGEYTIPYRCCVPEKIHGLLLAGRNISGSHKAHSNYRVMCICMNIGHGVGTAAAVAIRTGQDPRDIDIHEVQRLLREQGMQAPA